MTQYKSIMYKQMFMISKKKYVIQNNNNKKTEMLKDYHS